MALITDEEFEAMERLLANLLDAADAREEAGVLRIHKRITRIRDEQKSLRASRERLEAVRSRTSR